MVAVVLLVKGIPAIWHSLRTESTDDAYVNSYVTFVAPRVAGQVAKVLVGEHSKLLYPFRFERFATGDLHPVSSSPYEPSSVAKRRASPNARS